MTTLINIAISIIASAVIFIGGMNVPASWFSIPHPQLFGTSLTTISSTDNLADFPTTYNTNLTAINAGKIEVGTTSVASITTLGGLTSASALATIGTITSGIWNGTAIPVLYGGTGTTSPTSNQVMLGNGASGFKVVSGFGNSGQFLTSGGSATPPTWTTSAVDQTLSYNWTGSSFLIKNLSASSTVANPMTLNGLAYTMNSARQASSTVLMEDGSGNLSFNSTYAQKFYLNTATASSINTTASTTIFSVSVPGGTLGTSNAIECRMYVPLGVWGVEKLKFDVSYGGTATSTFMSGNGGGSGNLYSDTHFLLSATGATNTQKLSLKLNLMNDSTPVQDGAQGITSTPNVDSTTAKTLFFVFASTGTTSTYPAGQVVCTLIR